MTKKAFKVDFDTYVYLWEKSREKRYKEYGKTPRPLNERELADKRKWIVERGHNEIWDDTFNFTIDEIKAIMDEAGLPYEETTVEVSSL